MTADLSLWIGDAIGAVTLLVGGGGLAALFRFHRHKLPRLIAQIDDVGTNAGYAAHQLTPSNGTTVAETVESLAGAFVAHARDGHGADAYPRRSPVRVDTAPIRRTPPAKKQPGASKRGGRR